MPTSVIPLEELLKPLPGADPCGPDPSFDADLTQLQEDVKGKPEVEIGEEKRPAQEPNWVKLLEDSVKVAGRAKDLRAGVILTLAALKVGGLAGFRDGLKVLDHWLTEHWEGTHPRLDPDDAHDPTQRLNILGILTREAATFGDSYRIIDRLRAAPLCRSNSGVVVTFADVAASRGAPVSVPEEGRTALTAAEIESALRSADATAIEETRGAVAESLQIVKRIDSFLESKVGSRQAISFEVLEKALDGILGAFAGSSAAPEGAGSGASIGGAGVPVQAAESVAGSFTGAVKSREDVVRALNAICEFYRRNEPSSPIPYLLGRAQRMVTMNFLQIAQEITPEALATLKTITGIDFSASERGSEEDAPNSGG